jgi:limonene 1,2-monooxygenase
MTNTHRAKMKFGAFLAPHHPIGESFTLQLQGDLELVTLMDSLGYDEFWCGEHHSTGWETIASPELFLAAAAERTQRIRLGTGVVSLPYHHPFHVAQRMVQLDHQSRGRVIFGSGPGALPSDAYTLGVDPMVLRDRQDEAMGVIRKLLDGDERFTYECEWFTMRDAKLQVLPIQRHMPFAVASSVSPSGMTLAGKHGTGVLSVASTSTAGLAALPLQWSYATDSAAKHGNEVDRADWRVVLNWHIAETRDKAREEARDGLMRWNNEYGVGTLAGGEGPIYKNGDEAVDAMAFSEGSAMVIGTVDDLVERILELSEITGGFGTVLGFVHDWCTRTNNLKSWDMVARYVIPKVNNELGSMHESNLYVRENRDTWARATKAVIAKIIENPAAAAALTKQQQATRKAQTSVRLAAHSAMESDPPVASKRRAPAAKKPARKKPASKKASVSSKNAVNKKAVNKKAVSKKPAGRKAAGKKAAVGKAKK